MPSDSYPFAVGRIKGLERGFLDRAELARMSELPSAAAVKALADAGYGKQAKDKSDADELIDAEMTLLRQVIDELTPRQELTDLFFFSSDAVNLKLLFKARLLGETPEDGEFARGLFDAAVLRKAVENGDYSSLPSKLAEGLADVELAIQRGGQLSGADPFTVSALTDKAVYAYIFGRLKKLGNAFVTSYFKAKADFTNILSFLRARALNWDKSRFELVFVDGGSLSVKNLSDVYALPLDGVVKSADFGGVTDAARRGLNACINENGGIAAAAAVFDGALEDLAGSERHDSFGIGPVVFYLLKKLDEGRRVRVLFAGKSAGQN